MSYVPWDTVSQASRWESHLLLAIRHSSPNFNEHIMGWSSVTQEVHIPYAARCLIETAENFCHMNLILVIRPSPLISPKRLCDVIQAVLHPSCKSFVMPSTRSLILSSIRRWRDCEHVSTTVILVLNLEPFLNYGQWRNHRNIWIKEYHDL